MSNNVENDRGAETIETPSTSVLKEKINLDVPCEENKQNSIDNKGNFSVLSDKK